MRLRKNNKLKKLLGNRRSRLRRALFATGFTVAVLFPLWTVANNAAPVVRGKSSALPLVNDPTPEQQRAQNLALSDVRVQEHTVGRRAEVFGVRRVLAAQFTPQSQACASADCRQVEIYLFDENAAVTAIVNLDTDEVLDVLYQPGMQPGISKSQSDRALEIALKAPEVVEALGYRPLSADMPPVAGGMPGTTCDDDHYCVAPTFKQGDRMLWAVVDLTAGELAGIHWGEVLPAAPASAIPSLPTGCPQPGGVVRDGWKLAYATTGTDGLRVYDVSYNGSSVLTGVKHLEWHVDYGVTGFVDVLGCGGGGGGFQIYPFGETQVLTMTSEAQTDIGFEVVQDFRMTQWGEPCNYRYDSRLQFFADGRFRIASAAYGQGCEPDGVYRPVVRIDIAVDGDDGDTFSFLDEGGWHTVITETYRVPYAEPGHGPHVYNLLGSAWSIFDQSGSGYFIVGDRGQYPQSRGASPFIYITQHHPEEGQTDMGVIGQCCLGNHFQGPEMYLDGEPTVGTNLVLWYVPQMATDVDSEGGDYYCWTVSGEPDPETYPCVTGPLFLPFTPQNSYYFPLIFNN